MSLSEEPELLREDSQGEPAQEQRGGQDPDWAGVSPGKPLPERSGGET